MSTKTKPKTVNFDELPIGAIFYADDGRLVSFRKTAHGVTFGCYRRGTYSYRRSVMYGPNAFKGSQVQPHE